MRRPGGEIEVFESHDPGTGSFGTVAMCVRDHINAASATCMWTTDTSFLPDGKYLNRVIVQGSILTTQRNECIRRLTGDWILFVDDDMVWNPDDIARLYASWREVQDQMDEPVIMGGLCHRRTPPHDATMYVRTQPTSGPYRFMETWDNDIVEVDATGMAFLLIPVAALAADLIGGIPAALGYVVAVVVACALLGLTRGSTSRPRSGGDPVGRDRWLAGGAVGLLLGAGVQKAFPILIRNFFPIAPTVEFEWVSIAEGLGLSLLSTLLFVLPPLLEIRQIKRSEEPRLNSSHT